MENVTRRWTACAALVIVAIATSCADNQPVAPNAKAVSAPVRNFGTLTVHITPTNSVPPRVACHWTATVSGGSGTIHYAWTANNVAVGTDSSVLFWANNGGSFHLVVTVTDASGQAFDSKVITVASGATCT